MQEIVYVILRGALIGVLISAPMGPIGMLVIQRTLYKGRWPAFFTGIGAATSDLFYSLLTGFGISFITDFIQDNQSVLQIVGSVVIALFAAYLFRKNPSRALSNPKPRDGANTFWKDLVSGFLLTFSNPLILFFIIGLFARFNFLLPEFRYYHYVAGYASIFAGALVWWFTITFFIDKVRGHFNVRSLWLINRIIASILGIMVVIGLYLSMTELLQ